MAAMHASCRRLHGCYTSSERLQRELGQLHVRCMPTARVAAALVDTTSFASAQQPHQQSQTTPAEVTTPSWDRRPRNELPSHQPPATSSVQQLLRAASASWVLAGAAVVLLPLLLLYKVADQCSSFVHGSWCWFMQAPVTPLGSWPGMVTPDAATIPTNDTNSSSSGRTRTSIPGGPVQARNSAGRQMGPGSPSCFPLAATLFLGLLCSLPLLVVGAWGPALQPWLCALVATALLELACLMWQPALLRHGSQQQQQQQQQREGLRLAWAGASSTPTYSARSGSTAEDAQHGSSSSSSRSRSSPGSPPHSAATGQHLPLGWWLCQATVVCSSTLRCWLLLQLALRAGSTAAGCAAAFLLGCCLCSQVAQLVTWAQ